MPKRKTIKAAAKRFKISKNGKIIMKKGGQDHFNAREAGKVTRNKRRPIGAAKVDQKNIHDFLPYHF